MNDEIALKYADAFILQSRIKFCAITATAVIATLICGYRVAIAKDNAEGLSWMGGITTAVAWLMKSPGSDLNDALEKARASTTKTPPEGLH